MNNIYYEPHIHSDPELPIIFHLDIFRTGREPFLIHFHENIEILYIIQGKARVSSNLTRVEASEGELVVISSNCIHNIESADGNDVFYHCLIIDSELCESFGIDIEEIAFNVLVKDDIASQNFLKVKKELEIKGDLYKSAAKAAAIELMIHLYRNHISSKTAMAQSPSGIKMEMVKKAIVYIQKNFNQNISTEDVAKAVGLSKSYFCRLFKEVTRCTVVSYINKLRCYNAKKLFSTGKYLVSEAALLSGFDNLSYFSKTYKKHMGTLPSKSLS